VKRLFRLAAVQSTLAFLLAAYLGFVGATMRWRMQGADLIDGELTMPEGGMLFFWHGQIGLVAACRRVVRRRKFRVMISLSPDGEFVTKAAARLGFPAIRGSAQRHAGQQGKGGAAAFMEALGDIARGDGVIITPDGPRGPAEVLQAGPVMLAKRAKTRVYLIASAARPVIRLRSWDRTRLPLPFSRGCALFDGPLRAPVDADRAALEAVRVEWQQRLAALNARAEAMLDAA
jgi:hypothetical protein